MPLEPIDLDTPRQKACFQWSMVLSRCRYMLKALTGYQMRMTVSLTVIVLLPKRNPIWGNDLHLPATIEWE